MTTVFIKLLNMSIAASWLVLAVILLRIILKNAPKWIRCILWGLVAVRLTCPISIESIFSLLPSAETVPQDIMYVEEPTIHTGVMAINSAVNPYISESMAPGVGDSVNPMQVVMSLATLIWVVGMIGLFLYAFVSFLKIKNKADVSLLVRENIYLSDYIDTPFVLGIIRPRIYLPSALAEDDKADFVIAHEKAHIRRRDHWWKPLGFLLLTIYWFNPVIWIAYILLCRDIELACDENVIGRLKENEKKSYSEALLSCSMRSSGYYRNMISACPLAFGEVGVKDRVKAVLHYRKPAFWLVLLGLLGCIIVAVCFLTNPKDNTANAPEPFGHSYRVEKVVYGDLRYSFMYTPDTAPRFQFTSDYGMLVSGDILDNVENEKWVQQFAEFEEVKLSPLIFDDYFKNGTDSPTSMIGPDTIRANTKKAWRIDITDDENGVFYYFILTNQGDVYLTYGYDVGDSYAASEDGSLIRWVFKLARTDEGMSLLKQYEYDEIIGMSYKDFQKLTGVTAELYHANFYAAQLPASDVTVIFLGEGWDDENAMSVLREEDRVIRVEGRLDEILDEDVKECSLSEFVNESVNQIVDYRIEEGAGTAYYVADSFASIKYDLNGDGVPDRELQIALDNADNISPDAYCWLCWPVDEMENVETTAVDGEYVLNQAIKEAILNQYKPEKPDELYHCVDFVLLEQEKICGVAPVDSGKDNMELITVYGMALHESLGFSGATFHEVEYDYVPVKLKFQKESEYEYVLKDAWFPEKPIESWDIYSEAIWDTFSPYSEELATDAIYAIQDYIYLTSLRQNCYEQAVSYGAVDTDTVIEGLLEEVVASPGTFASGVKDYMVVNGAAYKELIHYGKYTLWYCFGEFLEGGQTDLRGHIMAAVCRDIALGWRDAQVIDSIYPKTTGQEWFDTFKSNAEELQKQYSEAEMNELYPASWLLLQVIQLQVLSK